MISFHCRGLCISTPLGCSFTFLWLRLFLIFSQVLISYWCELHLFHHSIYILDILIVLILSACGLNSFLKNILDGIELLPFRVFYVIKHKRDDQNRFMYISNIYFLHLNHVYIYRKISMFTYLLFAHALTSSIKLVGKKMQNGRREKCFSSSFSSYRMLSHIKIKTSALHEIRAYLLHLNYSWSITFNDFRLEEQNLFFSVYWTQWRHVV